MGDEDWGQLKVIFVPPWPFPRCPCPNYWTFCLFEKLNTSNSCSSLLNFVLQIQMITMSDFQERGWKQTAWSAVRDRCKRKTRSRRSSTSTWTRCCSPPRSPGLTSVNMVNMGHLVNTENYHKKLPKGQRRAFEWDPRLTTASMANFFHMISSFNANVSVMLITCWALTWTTSSSSSIQTKASAPARQKLRKSSWSLSSRNQNVL